MVVKNIVITADQYTELFRCTFIIGMETAVLFYLINDSKIHTFSLDLVENIM